MQLDDRPRISIFTHRHGTSFGLVPAGEDLADYWARTDAHDPSAADETVDAVPLPMPYAAAQQLLDALKEANATLTEYRAYSIEMRKIGRGFTPRTGKHAFSPEQLANFIETALATAENRECIVDLEAAKREYRRLLDTEDHTWEEIFRLRVFIAAATGRFTSEVQGEFETPVVGSR
jgi:hypothetical protein